MEKETHHDGARVVSKRALTMSSWIIMVLSYKMHMMLWSGTHGRCQMMVRTDCLLRFALMRSIELNHMLVKL